MNKKLAKRDDKMLWFSVSLILIGLSIVGASEAGSMLGDIVFLGGVVTGYKWIYDSYQARTFGWYAWTFVLTFLSLIFIYNFLSVIM